MEDFVKISKKEYDELIAIRDKYEKQVGAQSSGGKRAWANLSAEERSARAKKAVEARKKKLGW